MVFRPDKLNFVFKAEILKKEWKVCVWNLLVKKLFLEELPEKNVTTLVRGHS